MMPNFGNSNRSGNGFQNNLWGLQTYMSEENTSTWNDTMGESEYQLYNDDIEMNIEGILNNDRLAKAYNWVGEPEPDETVANSLPSKSNSKVQATLNKNQSENGSSEEDIYNFKIDPNQVAIREGDYIRAKFKWHGQPSDYERDIRIVERIKYLDMLSQCYSLECSTEINRRSAYELENQDDSCVEIPEKEESCYIPVRSMRGNCQKGNVMYCDYINQSCFKDGDPECDDVLYNMDSVCVPNREVYNSHPLVADSHCRGRDFNYSYSYPRSCLMANDVEVTDNLYSSQVWQNFGNNSDFPENTNSSNMYFQKDIQISGNNKGIFKTIIPKKQNSESKIITREERRVATKIPSSRVSNCMDTAKGHSKSCKHILKTKRQKCPSLPQITGEKLRSKDCVEESKSSLMELIKPHVCKINTKEEKYTQCSGRSDRSSGDRDYKQESVHENAANNNLTRNDSLLKQELCNDKNTTYNNPTKSDSLLKQGQYDDKSTTYNIPIRSDSLMKQAQYDDKNTVHNNPTRNGSSMKQAQYTQTVHNNPTQNETLEQAQCNNKNTSHYSRTRSESLMKEAKYDNVNTSYNNHTRNNTLLKQAQHKKNSARNNPTRIDSLLKQAAFYSDDKNMFPAPVTSVEANIDTSVKSSDEDRRSSREQPVIIIEVNCQGMGSKHANMSDQKSKIDSRIRRYIQGDNLCTPGRYANINNKKLMADLHINREISNRNCNSLAGLCKTKAGSPFKHNCSETIRSSTMPSKQETVELQEIYRMGNRSNVNLSESESEYASESSENAKSYYSSEGTYASTSESVSSVEPIKKRHKKRKKPTKRPKTDKRCKNCHKIKKKHKKREKINLTFDTDKNFTHNLQNPPPNLACWKQYCTII